MIFILMFCMAGNEREAIQVVGIRHAGGDLSGDIVVRICHSTTALDCEDLKREVSRIRVVKRLHPAQKVFVRLRIYARRH